MEQHLGNKQKRIRASKPKVRSGCITCKYVDICTFTDYNYRTDTKFRVRRVKCDETRPGCNRCKKFGRECDGYLSDLSSSRGSLVPMKPRPSCVNACIPAFSIPGDEQEHRYYQLFCDRTASDLAGYYPTDFWKRIAVQESFSEPAIRHAVVALGALTKSLHESKNQPFAMIMPPSNASVEHHEFALKQYNKAIVNLRQTISEGKPQIRTALVACLLFVCFENFHGDYEAAAKLSGPN
jgi:hypothetical protein